MIYEQYKDSDNSYIENGTNKLAYSIEEAIKKTNGAKTFKNFERLRYIKATKEIKDKYSSLNDVLE